MVEPVELQTDRLLLRRFRSSDVEDSLVYRDDPEFSRYLPHIPQPFTRRNAEEHVARNIAEPWDEFPTFAVIFDGRVIGTVNFHVDRANGIAMLGYDFGRAYWGKGFGLEAVRAAVAWAFEAFDLAKIWATTDARNRRSRRLLETLGMTLEGCLRSHERARDGRADKVYYGLLRAEWAGACPSA